jgi:hypothetical protein
LVVVRLRLHLRLVLVLVALVRVVLVLVVMAMVSVSGDDDDDGGDDCSLMTTLSSFLDAFLRPALRLSQFLVLRHRNQDPSDPSRQAP